ncbi:MAG: ABC transporter permease [Microbacteriaceae bacterium]
MTISTAPDDADIIKKSWPFHLQALSFGGKYGTVVVLVGMTIAFLIAAPTTFGSSGNILAVLTNLAPGAIVAIGLTICLVAGDFDLSVGYQASIAGVFVVGLLSGLGVMGVAGNVSVDGSGGLPLWMAIPIVLAVGCLFGLINGLVVTKLGVNALIATLGTGTIIFAVNLLYGNGVTYAVRDDGSFLQIYLGKVFGIIPIPIVVLVVFVVASWLLLNMTPLGQHIKAVGDDSEAARRLGINVSRTRIYAFIITGFCGTAGGIMLAASLGSGDANAGDVYLLQAFAAAFLGSAALRDGEFHIIGTILGCLTVAVGFNGLAIFSAPAYTQYLFAGGLLVVAVALSTLSRKYVSDL